MGSSLEIQRFLVKWTHSAYLEWEVKNTEVGPTKMEVEYELCYLKANSPIGVMFSHSKEQVSH